MKHALEARRKEIVHELTRINRKIAAEQQRLAQIEARLATLVPVRQAA